MLKNMAASALIAGVAAGIVATVLQFAFVIPLLLEGELYEAGTRVHFPVDGSPQSEAGAPPIGGDWSRHLMTVTFNLITFAAYGLLLVALMVLAEGRGAKITPRAGLVWGLAGFLAVQLAPALGQPPELPGTIGGEVGPRQIWWTGTIFATTLGLWLVAFGRGMPAAIAGVALILAPHAIGAPRLDTYFGIAPPELAAHFATVSLGVAAAGWVVLGWAAALVWSRAEG